MQRLAVVALLFTSLACSQPADRKLMLETFDTVWQTVQDKHFDPSQLEDAKSGLSWKKLREEFRPRVEKAASMDEVRTLLHEMISRLKLSHFQIIASNVYKDLDRLPMGEGEPRLEVAVINGKAYVQSVEAGAAAGQRGVKPGWRIVKIQGREVDGVLARIAADKEHPHRIHSTQRGFLLARMSGTPGDEVSVEFEDGAGKPVAVAIPLAPPRGTPTKFGFLPPQSVWIDFGVQRNVGVFRFNLFLDPVRLMGEAQKAVTACAKCRGFVVDLRGNPGGIGALAMGLGGFFVNQPDLRLGQMVRRDMTLNFVLNPRVPAFAGPVAILLDGGSGSTSEIFAGGMQDIGRARIFGTKSMAAALPPVIEKLSNGDGFQYAVAH